MQPHISHNLATPARIPGLKAERASFPEVSKALEKVALEKGLQLHGPWLNKCIQLYETCLVRHGIMLVCVRGTEGLVQTQLAMAVCRLVCAAV